MGFLDGLKTLWSNPEVRDKAIACTMGATAVACAATYAVARAVSRKDREYLNEGRVVTIDGELYRELPNGELRPYFADRASQTGLRRQMLTKSATMNATKTSLMPTTSSTSKDAPT